MLLQRIIKAIKGEKNKNVKGIEGELLGYMITRQGVNINDLRNLKRVECKVILGGKSLGIIMIRIFNPDMVKKKSVNIDSYTSLDQHRDLILYEGYYREMRGEAMDIKIEKKQ